MGKPSGASNCVVTIGPVYAGCVTGSCPAELGYRSIGVDRDEFKARAVRDGRAPFCEPRLEGLVKAQAGLPVLDLRGALPAAAAPDPECIGE